MIRVINLVVAAAVLFLGQPHAEAAEELQAGVAIVDITPPVPLRMSGYFNERLSTGVKDPLQAKAIVLRQGNETAAIVLCDLIAVSGELSTQARQQASHSSGIPVKNIVVAATHTHTGPLYFGSLHEHFHKRATERFGTDPYDTRDYEGQLADKIASAVADANSGLRPVRLEAGYANEDGISFNRRFFMKDGSVRFNPGALNPNTIRAAGPIDPQVGVILVKQAEATAPVAAIVSFALHLDTLSGTQYSADYPKVVEDRLRQSFGPGFVLLFGTGTCGDINHIDVTTRDVRKTPEIGATLAESIEHAVERKELVAIREPALAMRAVNVELPLQRYTETELAEARKNMDLVGHRKLEFLEEVKACTIMDLAQRGVDKISLEVQAIRLDRNTAIVTLPGEVFVDLGMAIKSASPFKTTLVIELANDAPGYVPTRKAFKEGSYEIVNSRVEPGGGERLVEAAIGLLKGLE